MTLKLMSFNTQHCMNYITRQIDFDSFADTIRSQNADVIGLNEMRGKGVHPEYTAQVQELADRLGYHWYFAKAIDVNGSNPYGNGLLSRYPILSAETILIPDPVPKDYFKHYETRCVLKARIDVEGGLDVLVTHFGLNLDEQENAVATIMDLLPQHRCVLMGDFNVCPDNPVLTPIREAMFDTAALFDCEKLSFPSDAPVRKIDYLFTSRDISVLEADIPALVVSDHRPHTALVKL